MNLVSPERWVWLAVAIPIVILYVLRSRLRKQSVSTLLFWDELFDQKRQRSWWQRLRHWLSLLLQLIFLGLIVFALLDPLWSGQGQTARQIVLVLDNSASMSARVSGEDESSSTRFDDAIAAAQDVVRELRAGDEIALVTAGGDVRVIVGMTDFGPAARDALSELRLTDGPTRISGAVEAARRMTRSPERREIVVISDGGFDDYEAITNADDVRLIPIGEPADNIAITQMSVRRSLVDPIGYAAMVEVNSFAEVEAECRISIELDDELIDVIPVTLSPGEVWKRTIVGASADGGVLTASMDIEDSLAIDNVARAVLPERSKIPVTLVTREPSLYLESVLRAIPLIDLKVTDQVPDASPIAGFTVLHRSESRKIPGGSVLVVDPQADTEVFELGDLIEQPLVASQDTTSPLMPHVRLQNVILPGARGVTIADGGTSLLIDAGGETLMASRVAGGDRLVVLTANLDDGDLPLRIAFPVLMTNAVNWFLSRSGEIEPAIRTGELARVGLPVSGGDPDTEWTWVGPGGSIHVTTTEDESALVGPVDRVGMVTLERSGRTVKTMAVNLCDVSESDLRSMGELKPANASMVESGRRSIWFYLTCLALGLIVAEWFLYQRRIVG